MTLTWVFAITLFLAPVPGSAGHDAQPLDAVTLRRGVEVDDVGGVAQARLDITVDISLDITLDIIYDLVAGLGPHVVEGVGLQSLQVVDAARGWNIDW